MNLKGKLSTNASLTGNASIPTKINTGGASTWNEISGKPFNTLGEDFTVIGGELGINSSLLLDGYATESYVDDAIADIPATDWDDITNKPTFATVATTGDYDDLLNKPTIPIVPTDVSAFNNDAGYITDSALTGYATETYVNGATATVYDSITTTLGDYATKNYAEGLTTGLATEDYVNAATSAISVNVDWADVTNKPAIASSGSNDGVIVNAIEGVLINSATGDCAYAQGISTIASGTASHAEGAYTKATGHRSHAEGDNTSAVEYGSHAEGVETTANGTAQHVQGRKNIVSNLYLDIVGNGTTNPSNAEATDWNGNKYLAGDVYTGVTNWASTPTVGANKLASESYVNGAITPFITNAALTPYVLSSSLTPVAFSGDYTDLANTPVIPAATSVTVTQGLTTGIVVGDIDVNGVTTTLYAPDGGGSVVSITNTLSSGTAIGDLDIDGVTTTLYAPAASSAFIDAGGTIGNITFTEATFSSVSATQIQLNVKGGVWQSLGKSSKYYIKLNFTVNNKDCYRIGILKTGSTFSWGRYASNTAVADFTIEGFEDILSSYEMLSGILRFNFKAAGVTSALYPPLTTVGICTTEIDNEWHKKEPLKVSSYFLPLDNSTIVRDLTSGNIKTAIPAPPTTDGTYTLQATVSNSGTSIVYSWI